MSQYPRAGGDPVQLSMSELRPGDLMFGPIGGATGVLVGLGQIAVSPWKRRLTWKTWWRVRHCGTVIEAGVIPELRGSGSGNDGGPVVAQAEPGGYEKIVLGYEHWTSDYTYIRPHYQALGTGPLAGPGRSQAQDVALAAQTMVQHKIPYAFEDYAAIAAHRTHLPVPHLDHFISETDGYGLPRRAICSQGVDAQLTLSGMSVFDDDRLPQDVIPSELYLRLLEMGPEMILVPGDLKISAPQHIAPRAIPNRLL